MSDIHPNTITRHGAKTWREPENFLFASQEQLAVLLGRELPNTLMYTSIGFSPQGEALVPVALLSLGGGSNLLVDAKGRWLGRYIPEIYKSFPFRLGKKDESEVMLCIDKSSGLLGGPGAGESFFEKDGSPSDKISAKLEYLVK